MKKFVLVLIVSLIAMNCFSQGVKYSKVIYSEGKTAQELYSLSRQWIARGFSQPKKTIQVEDDNTFFIGCKASCQVFNSMSSFYGWVDYTLIIQCKDGRLKVEITDLTHTSNRVQQYGDSNLGLIEDKDNQFTSGMFYGAKNKACADIKEYFKTYTEAIFSSLSEYLNAEQEEW